MGDKAKVLRAVDLTECEEYVVKKRAVAPVSILFLSYYNLLDGLTLLNILALL